MTTVTKRATSREKRQLKRNAPVLRKRPALPPAPELDVLALDAAGFDTTRGQKWQRGYVAGFKDGFLRESEGKR